MSINLRSSRVHAAVHLKSSAEDVRGYLARQEVIQVRLLARHPHEQRENLELIATPADGELVITVRRLLGDRFEQVAELHLPPKLRDLTAQLETS